MIDTLYDRRANLQKETELIRELCSQDQGTALRALEEMRADGSLQDGSPASAILSWADLYGVARPAGSLSSRPLGCLSGAIESAHDHPKESAHETKPCFTDWLGS